ncbi:MAG: HAMP domain-containing sensor histidine kinase [Pseudomonadota bacterium]
MRLTPIFSWFGRGALDGAAEAACAPIAALDRKGRLKTGNRAFFQFAPGAKRGADFLKSLAPEARAGFEDALRRAKAGEPVVHKAVFADRTAGPCELVITRARGGYALFVRDLSTQSLSESALKSERERADAAARSRAEMLADMSHEIRTPLNAVIGFADALKSAETLDVKRAREYAELIHKGGRHVLDLVSDMLDVSKIDAGKYRLSPQAVDVAALARECGELVRLDAEKSGLDFVVDVANAPIAMADPRAVRQILLNLLSNAIKFTDAGRVTLRLRVDESDIWMSVADTGVGMAAEDVARVGERYLDPLEGRPAGGGGTGLGLALAQGLAELHGGELTLSSQRGRGTTATVRLPIKGVRGPDDGVLDRIARVRAFGAKVSGERGVA